MTCSVHCDKIYWLRIRILAGGKRYLKAWVVVHPRMVPGQQVGYAMNSPPLWEPTNFHRFQFSSVQSLSRVRLFATPWIAAHQASLSITNSQSSLTLTSSSQWCHPAISSSVVPFTSYPQSLPASESFFSESTLLMKWPKYWSFSFSIIPSKEIPGLISFKMDWLDLLAVQGTLKSFLQHHSSKVSILRRSALVATVLMEYIYRIFPTWKKVLLARTGLEKKLQEFTWRKTL